jgi:hypothetical protein
MTDTAPVLVDQVSVPCSVSASEGSTRPCTRL